jgi:molybdate transport system permease protein
MYDLWPTLWLSIRIASTATLLAAIFALPLAYLASRRRFAGLALLESLLTLPLVLPPTVVGYLIIVIAGRRGWVGQWIYDWFGYSILFRFEAAVLAAAVVALPLLYLPAKAAFATVDRDQEDNARLMGASPRQVFFHVSLPLARTGIISGLVLAFARAIGEFGATLMVFGWQPGRATLPISIYSAHEQGELSAATPAVIMLTALSILLVSIFNRLTPR